MLKRTMQIKQLEEVHRRHGNRQTRWLMVWTMICRLAKHWLNLNVKHMTKIKTRPSSIDRELYQGNRRKRTMNLSQSSFRRHMRLSSLKRLRTWRSLSMISQPICGVSRMLRITELMKSTSKWTTNSWTDFTKQPRSRVRTTLHNTSSNEIPKDWVTKIASKRLLWSSPTGFSEIKKNKRTLQLHCRGKTSQFKSANTSFEHMRNSIQWIAKEMKLLLRGLRRSSNR